MPHDQDANLEAGDEAMPSEPPPSGHEDSAERSDASAGRVGHPSEGEAPADPAATTADEASPAAPQEPTRRIVETDDASYEIIGVAPAAGRTSAAPAPTETGYRASYVFLAVVTLVNLVADLWSKSWAKSSFEDVRPGGDRRVVVVEDFMNFIFAKNRGGAWGLLQNETEAIRRPFFLIVSVAAIVFIVSLYRKLQPGQTALKWGLPLVLGGALGNLIDRIRYGYVIDFIDVYMTWDGAVKHWPTFNVADISICVGVGLMAIDMFTSREKKPQPKAVTAGGDKVAGKDEKASVEGA